MNGKILLTVLLITTTSYSQDTRQAKKAPPLSLFTKTYSKAIRTVQRLIKYFHKYVWASWSKASFLLLILCACITAEGMSNKALAQKKKAAHASSTTQLLLYENPKVDTPVQPTSQPKIPAIKNSHFLRTNAKGIAQGALVGLILSASGCALAEALSRLREHTYQQDRLRSRASLSYPPLQEETIPETDPDDFLLKKLLPPELQSLLISFVVGHFRKFHVQRTSGERLPEACEHTDYYDSKPHVVESLAFIDPTTVKFLKYGYNPGIASLSTSMCSCAHLDIISKKITPCKTHLREPFLVPESSPEEHAVSIYRRYRNPECSTDPETEERYTYRALNGETSTFSRGSRRVFKNKPSIWFLPFYNLLAIYEEITYPEKPHQLLDGEYHPIFRKIPLVVTKEDGQHYFVTIINHIPHRTSIGPDRKYQLTKVSDYTGKRYQLAQVIQESQNIYGLTVPLTTDPYPERVTEDGSPWSCPQSEKQTSESVNFFALNFDRMSDFSDLGYLGRRRVSRSSLDGQRYTTNRPLPRHGTELADMLVAREPVECVVYKRIHEGDFQLKDLFSQTRAPLPALEPLEQPPPDPEPTHLQKLYTWIIGLRKEPLQVFFH